MMSKILQLVVFVFAITVLPANPMLAQDASTLALQNKLHLSAINQQTPPAKLLEIMKQDWELDIKADSTEEEKRQAFAVLKHIIQAADFIISNPNANEKTALLAVRNKMQALGVLSRTGNANAAVQAIAMAKQLQNDKRVLVAREGKMITLSHRLQDIPKMKQKQQDLFVQQLMELFQAAELTERETQIAQVAAQVFEQAGHNGSAQKLFLQTAALLKKSASEKNKKMATIFGGAARRVGLPGKPMILTGKTIDGKDFDLKQLKGKVVLVQFWASWCNYCLQEMPHIMKLHSTYQPEGFAVVGVNLDDSEGRAKKIIQEMGLPWTQLFSAEADKLGMQNPNAVYYGITQLPLCILIDKKGNVITLQARGKKLDAELERIFLHTK